MNSNTFLPQNRRQRRLLLVFLLVLIGALVFYWYAFLREEIPVFFQTQPPPPQQISLDLSVFEHPAFLELGEPTPTILPFEPGEDKKINPFVR